MLEPSRSGIENIFVKTDVFTKYTLAVPTWDQRAETVAQVLSCCSISLGFLVRLILTRAATLNPPLSSSSVTSIRLRSLALFLTIRPVKASVSASIGFCITSSTICLFLERETGCLVFRRYSFVIKPPRIKRLGSPHLI